MSNVDQEKTRQQHAQLIKELPKPGGWFQPHMFMYQGQWLDPNVILSVTLMQNHFKHRSTDIFLSSFMKTGTTWLKSLMFSIINRSRFDFSDHPLLHQGPHTCFPTLERLLQDHTYTNIDVLPSPRLFASHFTYTLFPSTFKDPSLGCKFIYVCRDPKDVFVSKFHFMKNLRSKELLLLSLDEAFELFCEGLSEYGPYWDHVLGFWRASLESPNKILFLRYEEMKREPEVYVMKKLAEFMGVPISAEEEDNGVVEKIVKLCSFENLKNLQVNKTGVLQISNIISVNNHVYFRRGEVGDWKNHLTKEMGEKIDQTTRDKFKGSGLILDATLPTDIGSMTNAS